MLYIFAATLIVKTLYFMSRPERISVAPCPFQITTKFLFKSRVQCIGQAQYCLFHEFNTYHDATD